MKLGVQVGIGPGHTVLYGEPAAAPPKGHSPQFLDHICCDQMAGWIKMALGMEVGLSPGHIMLDGDPALPKGAQPPIFGPCLLWPKGWMDEAGTWHGGRSQPSRLCVRWGPVAPPQKGGGPPKFSAHVYCDQTTLC